MIERSNLAASALVSDPLRARHALAKEVGRVLAAEKQGKRSGAQVVRVAVPVEGVDAFRWLQVQTAASKVYWSGREEAEVVAAVGVADLCAGDVGAGLRQLRQLAPALRGVDAEVRYYGGLRFDGALPPDASWAPFGAYRFILPRFELLAREEQSMLVCNLVLPRDQARRQRILEQVEALRFPADALEGTLPLPVSRHDAPGEDGWHENVVRTLAALEGEHLEKVVLARKVVYAFASELDPVVLLKHLKAATPACFHFCFQVREAAAFVGASPERLFRRVRRAIESEAVAGTRPRGNTAHDDARLRRELLLSEKDRREHEYVRQSVQETLSGLCDVLHVDAAASEMRLARGRHLFSGLQGRLRAGVADVDVLCALHPTPAVGGYPTHAALRTIRDLETFDRGWYAGPVGWIGPEAAEFAVAIRSGLVEPGRLSLYSGAGIVPGSAPDEEWEEVEQKISDFIEVLGLDLRRTQH